MGSFVLSNISICDILNFAGRGKCSTPAVNGGSICCTRAYLLGELFQLFHQVLVADAERLHLVHVGLHCL